MTDYGTRLAAFTDKLANLDVQISVNEDGVYTACSSSEPRFCFDGYSQKEGAARTIDALKSYARVYHDLHDLHFSPHREDVPPPHIKFETSRPLSKLALAVA